MISSTDGNERYSPPLATAICEPVGPKLSQIIEFLIRVGAHKALFEFQDAKIVKSIKNKVNRVVNCETANLKKTVQAAQKQIEVINYIENNYGLHALSTALEDVAVARLKYPEYNIKELGEIFDPVLSKSAINHRLRRLNKFLKNTN